MFWVLMSFMLVIVVFTISINNNQINMQTQEPGDDPVETKQVYALTLWLNSSYYKSDGTVKMTVRYTLDGLPVQGATVTYQVDNSSSYTFFFEGYQKTNSTGYNHTYYRLPTPASGGIWTVYVSADKDGNVRYKNTTFTVDNSNPITATITSPTGGANIKGTVTISANAADNVGGSGVNYVQFWDGAPGSGTLLSTDYTAAYSYPWDTTTASNGVHNLQIRVYDFAGNYLDSAVTSITVDNLAPTGSITFPAAGAWVRGTITISATAADAHSGLKNCTFWLDGIGTGTNLGTDTTPPSPFTMSWVTTGATNGAHTLAIVVCDNAGNSYSSGTTAVNVDNLAPAGSITFPAAGAWLRGTITISVTASDANSGLKNCTFWLDGIGTGTNLGTDTTPPSPFTMSWDTTTATAGAHTLAIVVYDVAGNSYSSGTTAVNVDNVAPSGSITYPTAGAWVRGTITISVTSADANSGLKNCTFWLDGIGTGTNLGTDITPPSPFTMSWVTTGATNGAHTLAIVVYDVAGNIYSSGTTAVNVDNLAPTGSITFPAAGAWVRGTITISVTAADANSGLKNCTFWLDGIGTGTNLGTDTTPPSPFTMSWDTTTATVGAHTLAIVVYDVAGNSYSSGTTAVNVDNVAPSGSITSPTAGAWVRGTITIWATATDANSGLKNCTFWLDGIGTGTNLGTDTTPPSPFTMSWDTTTATVGAHTLAIVVYDVAGNSYSSGTTAVNVDNVAPTGSITFPAAGAWVRGTITISATSADANSGLKNCTFWLDGIGTGTNLGTDTTPPSPFTLNWDTTTASAGAHTLAIQVYDVAGNSYSSGTTAVNVDNVAPTGSITFPAAGAWVRGTITISVTSADANSGLKNCTFWLDGIGTGTNLGTDTTPPSPFTMSWVTTGATNGAHTLAIVVYDVAGNIYSSGTTAVNVDNLAPTGSITFPAAGAWVRGTITISATSADANSGLKNCTFWLDGIGTGTNLGTDTTPPSPFTMSWVTTGATNGAHTLAIVVYDVAGNIYSSGTTAVNVDNLAPTGSITFPAAGAWVRGTITISATSADANSGLKNCTFWLDGIGTGTNLGTDTTPPSPFTMSWDTTTATVGAHTLAIQVYDVAGNSYSSGTTAVNVDNVAPTGSITFPAAGAWVRGTITISATSADANSGLKNCTFWLDGIGTGTNLGTDITPPSPFTMNWDTTTATVGAHTLAIVVYDVAGNSYSSGTTAVNVDNVAPTGSITFPAAGAWLRGTITISATSADANSGLKNCTFWLDGIGTGTNLGTDTTPPSPFTLNWDTTTATAGAHTLAIQVYDVAGNSYSSGTTAVNVDNVAPTGSITFPTAGAWLRGTITISATSADANSGLKNCTFWLDGIGTGTNLGTDPTPPSPFTLNWDTTTASAGAHTLAIQVYDVAGNSYSSGTTAVNVDNVAPSGSITFPTVGAWVRGTITISATSADANSGLKNCTFWLDGIGTGTNLGTDTTPPSPFTMSWVTTGATNGAHTLAIVVYDVAGNSYSSGTTAVNVDNLAPTGSITFPAAGAWVRGTITISATSADANSGLKNCTFWLDGIGTGTNLGTDTTPPSPFTMNWDTTTASAGAHTLAIQVYDVAGNSYSSGTTAVNVDNVAPTGSITFPTAGAWLRGTITISATSADANSGLKNATFWLDGIGTGTNLGTDITPPSPFTMNWDTTTATVGAHTLAIVVYDVAGNSYSSGTTAVNVDNVAPTGSITFPTAGAWLRGTITISATSADANSGLKNCTFWLDGIGTGTNLGTDTTPPSPFTLNWDTTTASAGGHTLAIQVYDVAGNSYSSGTTAVNVDNVAPTGSITFPAAGAWVRGTITISVTSADANSGLKNCTFWLDGIGTGTNLGTDITPPSPFTMSWVTTGATNGAHTLAIVVYDVAGNIYSSGTTAVNVDNLAPTGSITYPTAGAWVRGTITISATAADANSGLKNATFWLDGIGTGTNLGTDITPPSPFTMNWDTTTATVGAHTLAIVVYDVAGNSYSSGTTAVNVDNVAPTGSLTFPTAGAWVRGTITISATAADANSGLKNATFWLDGIGTGTNLGTDTTPPSPFTMNWDTTTATVGAHTLAIQVYDIAGNSYSSGTTAVNVDNVAPTGSITYPAASANVRLTITITATAADANSGLKNVTFWLDGIGTGTNLGTDTTPPSPFTMNWDTTSATNGAHTLAIVVYDVAGNSYSSGTTAITVDNLAPTGSITYPGAGSWVRQTITISATATDAHSGPKNVTFWLDGIGTGTNLGTDTTPPSPFTRNWDTTGATNGAHTLAIVVYDNAGNSYSSGTMAVNVDNLAPTGSITYPTAGIWVKGSITLGANAADTHSTVANVTFWLDAIGTGVNLGTDSISPYSMGWATTSTTDGSHNLYIRVYDVAGNVYDSTATAFNVDNAVPTTAVITIPSAGANVTGTITITATAIDGLGVKNVTFWDGAPGVGTLLGTDTTPPTPFTWNWNTITASDGAHTLYIRVFDNAQNILDSTGTAITVDNNLPTISISYPATDGADVFPQANNRAWINGTVSDATTQIKSLTCNDSRFTLYLNPYYKLSGPYAFYNNTPISGTIRVNVTVKDSAGNARSGLRWFNVVTTPAPTVNILLPGDDAIIRTVKIWINGTATAGGTQTFTAVVINDTRFTSFINLVGLTSGNFAFYNNTKISDGLVRVNVTAVNNVAQKGLDIMIFTLDNTAPSSATITSPTASANVRLTITISATAADALSGIKNVTFWLDGIGTGTYLGTDTSPPSPFTMNWDTTAATNGAHNLNVRAFDYAGNYRDSAAIGITVDNLAPTGSITSPSAGANVRLTITISANAADTHSGIASVTFWLDGIGTGTNLGTDSSGPSPYTMNWDTTAAANGAHNLYIQVLDNAGNTYSSGATAITVDNLAPTGSITSPSAGTNVRLTITISANAADTHSGVKNVTFWLDGIGTGTNLGTDITPPSPFTMNWDTSTASNGAHTLAIQVYDVAGNSYSSGTTAITVDNLAPTGSITSPSVGANVRLTITISATAADTHSGVANVTFWLDGIGTGTNLGTDTSPPSPFTMNWDTTAASNGGHTLAIQVYDIAGNSYSSGTTAITVDNLAPTGSITSPSAGAYVRLTISISANAADTHSGVASVTFWLDGIGTGTNLGTDSSGPSPYTMNWDTTLATNGAHNLYIQVLDNAGNTYSSGATAVTVDNLAPTGSIIFPSAGANVRLTISISANAADTLSGVASVTFWLDGIGTGTNLGTDSSGPSPYTMNWDTTLATNGAHNLYIQVVDNVGNTYDSGATAVTVDNLAPTGSITSPSAGAYVRLTISISANAADTHSGVKNVTFWLDGIGTGTNLGTDITPPSPFTMSWDTTAVSNGAHTLAIQVYDIAGNSYSSGTTAITVDNLAPTGSITSPSAGTYVRLTISISANAADTYSGVASVTFWLDGIGTGTNLGTDSSGPSPYTMNWDTTGATNGAHNLYIQVADNVGNTYDSGATAVTVDNLAPTGSIITPSAGANVRLTISISVNAADTLSGVASVTFWLDGIGTGTNLGTDSSGPSPYTMNWDTTGATNGAHNLYIQVADNVGNTYDSGATAVTVDNLAPTGSITSPSAGANVRLTITISANAADTHSGVKNVTFWLDGIGTGTNLGTDSSGPSPYTWNWDTTGATNGAHTLAIQVYDIAGNSYSSGTTAITVDNLAPTGSITSPSAGANVRLTITISANAADTHSGVASVTFWLDGIGTGTNLGTDSSGPSPYTMNWDTTAAANGAHNLYIRVLDNAGNTYDSGATAVTVDNLAPTGSITSPSAGANVRLTISISANAADTHSGVANVTFWLDGIGTGTNLGTDTSGPSPYTMNWDTTLATNGAHNLYIQVYDNVGNSYNSGATAVTVDNSIPTVTITYPAPDGAIVYMSGITRVWINGTASDSTTAINSISCNDSNYNLYTNPVGQLSAPYAYVNNTPVSGIQRVRITVTDSVGNTGSAARMFEVSYQVVPSVLITIPTPGAIIRAGKVWINGTASAGGGLAISKMLINGTYTNATNLVGKITGTFGYYNTSRIADGVITINITCVNSIGISASGFVTFRLDNTRPTVATITSPTGGANVRGTIVMSATGTDNAGGTGVQNVTFWLDAIGTGVNLGTDITPPSPYTMSWDTTGATNGAHNLYIRVYDFAGNYLDSGATAITVDNLAPTGSITSPTAGANVRLTISISANAADTHSGVASVTFWLDGIGTGTNLGTDSSGPSPYTMNWDTTGATNGAHNLYIQVLDNAGNTYDSGATAVTVDNLAPTGSITSPTAGANVRLTISISANAADTHSGVASVTFWLDGIGTGTNLGTDSSGPSPYTMNWDTTGATNGAHNLYIQVLDNAGNTYNSGATAVTVDNLAPTGSITSPSAGANVRLIISISANAADTHSGVASVTFWLDGIGTGTNLGTDSSGPSPYTTNWDTATATNGAHNLYIQVLDNAGNTYDSGATAVTVDNLAPTGSITSPSAGANVRLTISISANAADTHSGVASVTFWLDGIGTGTNLGTDSSGPSPYTMNWDTTGATNGAHNLYIQVLDNAGNTYDSGATAVTVDNLAPTGSITSPTAGANVRLTISISANAADTHSGVASVIFWLDGIGTGTNLGTDSSGPSPYTMNWDTTGATNGAHNLYIQVLDNAGNTYDSGATAVTVDNLAPTGSITSPSAGANVRLTISISANAADTHSGVASVTFWLDGIGTGTNLGTDSSGPSPYTMNWDTTGATNGAHNLYIQVLDVAGNTYNSGATAVTVDNLAPTGSITSPSAGANVHLTISISANAADTHSGVASVTFWLDGIGTGTNLGTDSSGPSPYTWNWDTTAASNGAHSLYIQVADAAGNTYDSGATAVTVDNLAPTGSITSPTAGANVRLTITISANAADTHSGVASVTFWLDGIGTGTNLGTDSSGPSPYTMNWDTTGATNGAHNLYIQVLDNAGNTYNSGATAITVDNLAPTGSITYPSPLANVHGTITITTNAADPHSGVKNVTFWLDGIGTGTSLGTLTSGPYNLVWNTVGTSNGGHTLAIQVYDNAENVLNTGTISITVDNLPPTGSITYPTPGAAIRQTITITTNAADAHSGVKNVTFWLDGIGTGTILGTLTSGPYNLVWDTTGTVSGSHNLAIRVYDNAENVLNSGAIAIIVDNVIPWTASIVSPANNSYVSGTISITGNGADAESGLKNITFWLDTVGGTLLGTGFTSPSSVSWNTGTATEGSHLLYVQVFDLVSNYRISAPIRVIVDNVVPIVTIYVQNVTKGSTPIIVGLNELILSLLVNVTDPLGSNHSVSMTAIPLNETFWTGTFPAVLNGNYSVFALATDHVGYTGIDTATFVGAIGDTYPPNFVYPAFSDPMGLLYFTTGPYNSTPDWMTYPECAGLQVHITIQFQEIIGASTPFRSVILGYSWRNVGLGPSWSSWNNLTMTFNGTTFILDGKYNVTFYTVTMPRWQNGTQVLLNVYAVDEANNSLILSNTYGNLEYLVLGNWIEWVNLTMPSLTPGMPFYVQVFGTTRGNYTLQIVAYFYNPSLSNIETPGLPYFKVWHIEVANMSRLSGNIYSTTWTDYTYMGHGQVVFVTIRILNTTFNARPFSWNGSYSLQNSSITIVNPGSTMQRVLATTNVTLGKIIDNVPPLLHGTPTPIKPVSSSADVEIHINLTDPGVGIKKVTLYYRIVGAGAGAGAGELQTAAYPGWTAVSAMYYGGEYLAIIPKQGAGSRVEFFIEALDTLGNNLTSSVFGYNVPAADYSLYIFLIGIIVFSLVAIVVVRRHKKGQVTAISGPKRYKLIKEKF